MTNLRVVVEPHDLAGTCRRHRIRRLAAFGSVLRDDFRSDSDVDLLVEFEAGHSVGWEIVDVAEDLKRVFGGHDVDLVNPKYLNHRLRDRILSSSVLLYAA